MNFHKLPPTGLDSLPVMDFQSIQWGLKNHRESEGWCAQNLFRHALKAFKLTNNMLQKQDHNQNHITTRSKDYEWISDDLLYILLKLWSVARFDGLPLTVTYWHQFSSTTLSFSHCMFLFSQPYQMPHLYDWLFLTIKFKSTLLRVWSLNQEKHNWKQTSLLKKNNNKHWKWTFKFLKFHFISFSLHNDFCVHQNKWRIPKGAYNLHHEVCSFAVLFNKENIHRLYISLDGQHRCLINSERSSSVRDFHTNDLRFFTRSIANWVLGTTAKFTCSFYYHSFIFSVWIFTFL